MLKRWACVSRYDGILQSGEQYSEHATRESDQDTVDFVAFGERKLFTVLFGPVREDIYERKECESGHYSSQGRVGNGWLAYVKKVVSKASHLSLARLYGLLREVVMK